MTPEELAEQIINEHLPLLNISGVLSTNEAYTRGAAFLTAQARLTNVWKELADQSIQVKAEQEQAWYTALMAVEGSHPGKKLVAAEKEAAAKANPEYQAISSRLELIKNNVAYVQSFIRQFENSYRIMSYMVKGEISG